LGDAIDRDDVGMLEPRDRARFAEEPLARRLIGSRARKLHRDGAIEQRIVREVNLPHRTAPERLHEPVLLERFRRSPLPFRHLASRIIRETATSLLPQIVAAEGCGASARFARDYFGACGSVAGLPLLSSTDCSALRHDSSCLPAAKSATPSKHFWSWENPGCP